MTPTPVAFATLLLAASGAVAHAEPPDHEIEIGARVQPGVEITSKVDADERTNAGAFLVRRARLSLVGHAFTPKLGYKFQTDLGRGAVTLKDFYIDGQIADRAWIRIGQWKRFWNRQQITSSGKLELVERAASDKEFRAGRDLGVAVHNKYEKSPDTEWAIGVFNGPGETPAADVYPVFLARAGLNRGDGDGYSEGDFEGGALRWGVAASVWIEGDFDGGDPAKHQAEVDFYVKHDGLSATGGVYADTVEQELDTIGAYAQVGVVFGEATRRMNAAARYNLAIPQGDGAGDPTHEVTVGAGWFPYAHGAKLQAEVGSQIVPNGGVTDILIARLQAQLAF